MATDSLSHMIYFRFNAPTNYFTDITYPNYPAPPSISFRPANTHVIRKEILGFHTINSPAFLLALKLLLPRLILTHALGNDPPENEQRRSVLSRPGPP